MDQVLVSTGSNDRLSRMSAILHPMQVVVFAIAALISLEAVQVAVMFKPFGRYVLLWGDSMRIAGETRGDSVEIPNLSGAPALLTALTAAAVFAVIRAAGITHPMIQLVVSAAAAGAGSIVLIFSTGHALCHEIRSLTGHLLPSQHR